MIRSLYSLLLTLLLPLAFVRLWFKGRTNPDYMQRWGERLGYMPDLPKRPRLWVHAVSVGETVAAAPLIRQWQATHPDWAVLVTTTTPTGAAQVRRLFGDTVEHCYLPFDLPGTMGRFIDRTRPTLGIVIETEIWPNLYANCHKAGIPLLLANARLSERSYSAYRRLRWLIGPTLRQTTLIAARSAEDVQRFVALGAEAPYVHAWGNLKFDLTVPASAYAQAGQWRLWWGEQRPVWIAASTHPEEELQVLTAHRHVLAEQPDALLVLAPRHPERLPAVLVDVEKAGFSALCRSALAAVPHIPSPDTPAPATSQVLVVDTLGELMTFYAACDVAFVGGSLVPVGGHNPLEPLALGKPTVTGPCVFNFDAVYAELTALEGTTTVASARGLGQHVAELLAQPERRALPATVVAWLQANQGSTARLLAYADQLVRRLEAAKAALQQP